MLSRAVKLSTRVATVGLRAGVTAAAPARAFSAAAKAYPVVPTGAASVDIVKMIDAYHAKPVDTKKTFFAGLGEVIKENGWYPFLGLGTAILLTKEILLVSPELLVMTDFIAFSFAAYVMASESIENAVAAERAKYIEDVNAVFDAKSAILKAHIEACQPALALPAVIVEGNAAFKQANEAAAAARDLVAKQAHKTATLAKLTALYNKEQEQLNALKEAVRGKSKEYIFANAQTAAVRASMLKEAIALVGAKEDKVGAFKVVTDLVAEAVKKSKASM